jgi:hypothetical protein
MTRSTAGAATAVVALAVTGALPAGGASSRPLDGLPALYSAGEEVDGLALTAVLRRDDTASYVSFVYGDCVPAGDTGCAPPAEVQVWPACRRSLALYRGQALSRPPIEPASVRGAPAAFLDGGARLELQTGAATVVVFAGSRGRLHRIAGALRAVDGSVPAGAPFPPPTPGALEGELPC